MCNNKSKGKHESVKHTIYTSIRDLLPQMGMDLVDHLFEQIKKVPMLEYDTETLVFLQSFTLSTLARLNVCY
jgi:hypothetical protein